MIERDQCGRLSLWKSRNRNVDAKIVIAVVVLICYCLASVSTIVHCDISAAAEVPNVSLNNEQQSNRESNSTTSTVSGKSQPQNFTDDVAIDGNNNTIEVVVLSVVERQVEQLVCSSNSKMESFFDSDSSTMSYGYALDDDNTYDGDAVLAPYVQETIIEFSNDQTPPSRIPNITIPNSEINVTKSDDDVVTTTLVNETTYLSTLPPPEYEMIVVDNSLVLDGHSNNKDDAGTLIMQQQQQANESELVRSEPETLHTAKQGKPEPPSEIISKVDSPDTAYTNNNDTATTTNITVQDAIQEDDGSIYQSINNILPEEISKPDHQVCYYCTTVWGDINVTRRRRPMTNLWILEQLFHGSIELTNHTNTTQVIAARTYNTSAIRRQTHTKIKSNTSSGDKVLPVLDHHNTDKLPPPPPQQQQQQVMNPIDDTIDEKNHVDGSGDSSTVFDDIDELFMDADPTDEFDVSTNDESIQEVLMGSATRMVMKRCEAAGRFVLNKAMTMQKFVFHHLTTMAENNDTFQKISGQISNIKELKWLPMSNNEDVAIFQWMQNDDGNFAPFRRFRNVEGDWIFLQNLRNDDGDLLGISNLQLREGLEWAQVNVWNALKKIDDFMDTILLGSTTDDNDELEFKFLSDEDFSMKQAMPNT